MPPVGDQPRYPLRRFAVSLLPFRIGLLPEPVADPAVGEAVEERLQRLVCQVVGPGLLDRRGRGAEALGQRDGLLVVGILLQQGIDLFERKLFGDRTVFRTSAGCQEQCESGEQGLGFHDSGFWCGWTEAGCRQSAAAYPLRR